MRTKLVPLMVGLVILSSLACTTPSIALFATPTPTASPTPTATATPTVTPSPVPTDTPTPLPTDTPEPSLTPTPDLSEVRITPFDLPRGFDPMPDAQLDQILSAMQGSDMEPSSAFGYITNDTASRFQMLYGFISPLYTTFDQRAFDLGVSNPDLLVTMMASALGNTSVSDNRPISGLDDIGESRAGVTVAMSIEGVPMRMDMIMFRRGYIGAYVYTMYINGESPQITIQELATKLDAHAQDAIGVSTGSGGGDGSEASQCVALETNTTRSLEMHASTGSYPDNCQYYCVDVTAGSNQLDIELAGMEVDLDIFVQFDNPVFTSDPNAPDTWTSNEYGTTDEFVNIPGPSEGTYYLEICSYEGDPSPFTLTATVR